MLTIRNIFSLEETQKPDIAQSGTANPVAIPTNRAYAHSFGHLSKEPCGENHLIELQIRTLEDPGTEAPQEEQEGQDAQRLKKVLSQEPEEELTSVADDGSGVKVKVYSGENSKISAYYAATTGVLLYCTEEISQNVAVGRNTSLITTTYNSSFNKIKETSTDYTFYENGQVEEFSYSEKDFTQGLENSRVKKYYEDGNLQADYSYSRSGQDASYADISYYPNGAIKGTYTSTENFENNSYDRTSKVYAQNGALKTFVHATQAPDGTTTSYRREINPETKTVAIEYQEFTNSLIDSYSFKSWDTDGNILENTSYKHLLKTGKITSTDIAYDPKNPQNLLYEYYCFDNQNEGEIILTDRRYEDGKLIAEEVQDTGQNIKYEKYYNADGSLIYSEEYTTSDAYGVLSHVIKDANGNVTSVLTEGIETENGVYIKKNFVSPNGEYTIYEFQEDEYGNSFLTYTITDENQEVLMQTQRSYQNINENTARSTYNGTSYLIDRSSNKLVITNENDNTQTVVDLDELVTDTDPKTAQEMKEFLKKQPADILLDLQEEIYGIDTFDSINGYYDSMEDVISTYPLGSTLSHELGHAISYGPDSDTNNLFDNEEFLNIYNEELKRFLDLDLEFKETDVEYLLEANEFFAESKLLTTSVQDEYIFARAQILQQYFPRSIAYANMLMDNVEDYIEIRK